MFRRSWVLGLGALAALSLVTSRAEAGWGLRNSFGQAIWLAPPKLAVPVPVVNADGSLSTTKLTACGNANDLCYDGNRRMPIDFEVMPYYNFGLLSIDLAVNFNLESRNDLGFNFHFRPGVRVYPFMGLFIRAFLDMTAAQLGAASAGSRATIQASFEGNLGVGLGYQFKLGPWGIFVEAGVNPRLWGNGVFNMPMEFRLGWLLEPS